ncbi:MAG: hypothetical protein K6E13_08855 [Lachnospiraceae bacterium]|nr:hypothetical protein [Lachnospiraceae bacterium]
MSNVVFLDIDGVLNTRTSCVAAPSGVVIGIDESRVGVLKKAMDIGGFDGVVLTTTWKNLRKDNVDYLYMTDLLKKHGIQIHGQTEDKFLAGREWGILKYIDLHPEVEEFVIIDDQHYGFDNSSKLWDRYLDKKGQGIENSEYASKTPSISAMLFMDGIR